VKLGKLKWKTVEREITEKVRHADIGPIALFVDKNGEYESLLPAVIVLAVIAVVAIRPIAGVILLILYIKLRAANKRS